MIGLAVVLAVKFLVLLALVWYFRREAKEQRIAGVAWRDTAWQFQRERNEAQDVASIRAGTMGEMAQEIERLRAALAEVATTIGRRPPRRKWLARARRVAQIAART